MAEVLYGIAVALFGIALFVVVMVVGFAAGVIVLVGLIAVRAFLMRLRED